MGSGLVEDSALSRHRMAPAVVSEELAQVMGAKANRGLTNMAKPFLVLERAIKLTTHNWQAVEEVPAGTVHPDPSTNAKTERATTAAYAALGNVYAPLTGSVTIVRHLQASVV
jgi:hypothetical protein